MDRFSFKQIIILIIMLFIGVIVSGLALQSCVVDRRVMVTNCPEHGNCSTITVQFHNFTALPVDTLNATAVKIIQGIQK